MAARWEALPVDVWALLLAALTGSELLQLSHASAWTWRLLAALDGSLWRERVLGSRAIASSSARPHGGFRSWREAFARHRVLRFPGLRVDCMDDDALEDPRAFVEALSAPETSQWWASGPSELSVDTWICLLPSSGRDKQRARFMGGVVFGQQSSPCASPFWPHVRASFMVVDADCNLLCSLLDEQQDYKLRRLTAGRWYHVALTYSRHEWADAGYQCVYIDGELASMLSGRLHRDWERMQHCQIGSGYVAAGLHACPRGDYRGWYSFNGLVDEFRVWDSLLTDADVQQLAAIRSPELLWTSDNVRFSMQRDGRMTPGVVRAAQSRPSEGLWAR